MKCIRYSVFLPIVEERDPFAIVIFQIGAVKGSMFWNYTPRMYSKNRNIRIRLCKKGKHTDRAASTVCARTRSEISRDEQT